MSRPALALFLGVLGFLAACGPRPSPPAASLRSREPAHDTMRQVPLGLCEDYPEETRSLDEVRRDFAVMKAAGVRVLRVSIGWDGVEPDKDRYELAFWDAFVDLADEHGIVLLPYVAYTPRWNSDGGPDDYGKTPPRDVGEFAEIMQLLATRYRGRLRSWELWNEPDNRDYWLGSAAQYGALLKAGSAAVRAAGPELQVVSGGLAGGVPFLRELLAEEGAASAIDVVNLHSYYETWNENPLETIPEYVDEVSAIIDERGGKQAIWMAEVGYSNWPRANEKSRTPRYVYEHSPDFQATMLVRTLALLFAKPAVSLVAWYELKDPRPADAMIGDDNNRHLGVVYADYRPKPAFEALSLMSRSFAAGFREVDSELKRAPAASPELELHGFVTTARKLLLIGWLKTRTNSPVTTAAAAAPLNDSRRERVHVSVPYAASGAASAFDARGRRLERAVEAHAAQGRTQISFDVSGGEVRIIELPIVIGP